MARILIVDDSPTETYKFREILERNGVSFHYETSATSLIEDANGRVIGVRALTPRGYAAKYGQITSATESVADDCWQRQCLFHVLAEVQRR